MILTNELDRLLEMAWSSFGDVPIDADENIEEPFLWFETGTNRYDIWRWFDENHTKGVVEGLMQRNNKKQLRLKGFE